MQGYSIIRSAQPLAAVHRSVKAIVRYLPLEHSYYKDVLPLHRALCRSLHFWSHLFTLLVCSNAINACFKCIPPRTVSRHFDNITKQLQPKSCLIKIQLLRQMTLDGKKVAHAYIQVPTQLIHLERDVATFRNISGYDYFALVRIDMSECRPVMRLEPTCLCWIKHTNNWSSTSVRCPFRIIITSTRKLEIYWRWKLFQLCVCWECWEIF